MAEPYLSEIRVFSFNFPPKGWAFCNGQIMQVQQNPQLYSLIGNTYGGVAPDTFGLPDLQSRTPIHMDGNYTLGSAGGAATNTLTVDTMPAHTHTLLGSDTPATTGAPLGAGLAQPVTQVGPAYVSSLTPSAKMSPHAMGNAGQGQPHNNMQPYLALNFCIALQGIYPPPT